MQLFQIEFAVLYSGDESEWVEGLQENVAAWSGEEAWAACRAAQLEVVADDGAEVVAVRMEQVNRVAGVDRVAPEPADPS